MAVHLTETAIRAAIRRASETKKLIELIDTETAGLRLRIGARGRRTWVVATRDARGSLRRFPVGQYPAMGIAEARSRAAVVKDQVKNGADPIADARRRRQIAREGHDGITTMAELVKLYGAAKGEDRKSWPEMQRRIESVFARQLKAPLDTLTIGDLQLAADKWRSLQSAGAACRYLLPILKWASAPGRRYVSRDLADLRPPATTQRRDRVLSRDELARLLPVLEPDRSPYHACLRFILLTLARREEAAGARWRDVDMATGVWTIPVTKNRKPHAVPLSRQALALLEQIKPHQPDPASFIFATSAGTRLMNFERATRAIQRESGTEGWHRHDLRRTGATMLGEMGETPDIIEAALNHSAIRSRLASTYNQARYRPQVAAALQRLADALDGIEQGAGQIVPMRK